MPDIKRRDKRQNNGTSFNKAEYGIGRPVGFNQDPRDLLLRAFYMGPLPNTYTPIYMRADELNVSNQRYELSLPSSSHFLAFVLSRKKIQLRQSRPNFLSLNKINGTLLERHSNVTQIKFILTCRISRKTIPIEILPNEFRDRRATHLDAFNLKFFGFRKMEWILCHRSNKFSFFSSFLHPPREKESGFERTVSRIAASHQRRTFKRLTSRPATSNVFLSRRFIARFLLQDRGQCARTLLL